MEPTLYSSVEKTNGAKLSRLLIDGGTKVLRNVFNGYHPPTDLVAGLNSNYSTLNNLLERRILHRNQWNQLFPPGGGIPDANTFDITLVFVLLVNICGLSPPSSGWHTKPPPSDTSLEANLARVKHFCNELHGHVTTTGVDTARYTTLRNEISEPLIALGLDQAEVERLSAECCGEEFYLNALFEWADSEREMKSQLKEVVQVQTKTLEVVGGVHQMLKKTVCKNLNGTWKGSNSEEILKNLVKAEFKGDIEFHAGRFQVNTRESVFKEIEDWLDNRNSQNRVMVISGHAGMGKSVISAVICKKMQEAGRLCGSHFCQHNNVRYRNPRLMLQSLASHLSHALPEYKNLLVEQLSRNLGADLDILGVEELFALLFKEPLGYVTNPGKTMLMVIDGPDESEYERRNELLEVIADHFCKLPLWIRFLVTTRPERNIAESLERLQPFQLESSDAKNLEDIELFFKTQLQGVVNQDDLDASLKKLVEKSEGLMLYAYFLVECIKKNVSLLGQGELDGGLPLGISSVYRTYFKRLEAELHKEIAIKEESFLNFLCAVTASREPLPLAFTSKVLGLDTKSNTDRRNANKAISCISALLPIRDSRLHIIHKSVKDWLTDKSCYGEHYFIVEEKEGHSILARLCADILDDVKLKGVHCLQFSDTEKYALQHGFQHMLELRDESRPCGVEEMVKKYVIDLEMVYAKLCANNTYDTVACEDVSTLQTHEMSNVLSGELQRTLSTLLFLLRKHRNTLRNLPHVFFQLALNEGGLELSREAANLLENRYSEVSYMECLDDKAPQNSASVELHCSDTVACFDVSPQLDYMVCECHGGTIQLWSLESSKLQWVRPVVFRKDYAGVPFGSAYKIQLLSSGIENVDPKSRPLSCYRSVVFHPNGNFVLPGRLSFVFTIGGEQKKLFPSSGCSFSVCQFSSDNTRIITDCLDDTRSLVMWSLATGREITRITREDAILSFACSPDGSLIAISHPQSICLFQMASGFRYLGETASPVACGIMKLSPDNQVLSCLHLTEVSRFWFRFQIRIEDSLIAAPIVILESIDQDSDVTNDSGPWEFEHRTNGGFLLGDSVGISSKELSNVVPFWEVGMLSSLNENCALMSSPDHNYLSLINLEKLKENRDTSETTVQEIVFSSNGETVYVVSNGQAIASQATVTAWNILNGKFEGRLQLHLISIVPVRDGVVLVAQDKVPEMWNFKLSSCVRRWSTLSRITKTFLISEELIACVGIQRDVYILATTNGEVVSTVQPFGTGNIVACNSKYQLITVGQKDDTQSNVKTGEIKQAMKLSNATSLIWEKDLSHTLGEGYEYLLQCIFSPKEEFVVVWGDSSIDGPGVYILDALSGDTHYTLPNSKNVVDCKFVSNEECVVYNRGINVLRLFNVMSSELLGVLDIEERPCCLSVCLPHHLIAIYLTGLRFKLIKVWSPQIKDERKSKRVQKTEQRKGLLSWLWDVMMWFKTTWCTLANAAGFRRTELSP